MILTVKDNLVMRNLTAEDAAEVYEVIDNNRVYLRKWLPWVDGTDSPTVIENVVEMWERQLTEGSDRVFGIFMDGRYIGNIGLHNIDKVNKNGMIGYWLAEKYQGSGIMTDCVSTLIKYSFDELEMNTIRIHCALGNQKSRSIPERLGFQESCIHKDGEIIYGIPHDMVIYSIDKLRLVFPLTDHKIAALAYLQEYIDFGETHIHGSGSMENAEDYESWRTRITSAQSASHTGWVNCSTYFAFVGDRIVGTIQIRHTLNDFLINTGGHIGYGVRPSERKKGYATRMLELALEKSRELGIDKALVTCDKDNIASAKTIQKCGGIFENEFIEENGNIVERYWITI